MMKNDVVVYKCLLTLHRLTEHGAPELITQMYADCGVLNRVKKAWNAQNSLAGQPQLSPSEDLSKAPVADLISIYADFLERRIAFCHKVSRCGGASCVGGGSAVALSGSFD